MSLVKCTVSDLLGPLTQRTISPEGFLIARGAIARAGNIQEYRASELGFDVTHGMDSAQIVRLYRPTAEVHSPETLKSFEGQTLTMGHPFGGVDAERWRTVAIGDVRAVKPDGDHVTSELVIRDAAAIKEIQSESGKRQLSCGYTFDCDMTAGNTSDGKAYHGTMTSIRGNHVAVVDMARGGPTCLIDDEHRTQETKMATRIVDGITLTFADDTSASLVVKVLDEAKATTKTATDAAAADKAKTADAEAKLAAEVKAKADLVAAHDAKVKELQAQILTPEQLEALAAERAKVVGDAARLCPTVKPEGKTVAAIRAEVVTAILAGDTALKGVATAMLDGLGADKAPAEAVTAAFKAIAAVPAASGRSSNDLDRDHGRRLAGAEDARDAGAQAITGRALMIFRQTHGGKSPSEIAAQSRA